MSDSAQICQCFPRRDYGHETWCPLATSAAPAPQGAPTPRMTAEHARVVRAASDYFGTGADKLRLYEAADFIEAALSAPAQTPTPSDWPTRGDGTFLALLRRLQIVEWQAGRTNEIGTEAQAEAERDLLAALAARPTDAPTSEDVKLALEDARVHDIRADEFAKPLEGERYARQSASTIAANERAIAAALRRLAAASSGAPPSTPSS